MAWLDLVDPISLQEAVRSQLKKNTHTRENRVNLFVASLSPLLHHPNIFAAGHTFLRISPISCAPQLSSPPTSRPPATPPPRRALLPSWIGDSRSIIGGESLRDC